MSISYPQVYHGAPSNTAVHFLLGTLPMRLFIIKAHLSFLFRILTLPDSTTANQVIYSVDRGAIL